MTQGHFCRTLLIAVAGLGLACASAMAQEPMQVGEYYPIHVDSRGASDVEGLSTATGQVFVITHPDATYMGVHFAKFHLAEGDFLLVSDADGGQSYTLEGKGKMNSGKFWAQHVKGDTIVLELVSAGDKSNRGFVVDQYAAGFVNLDPAIERICGANDFENAICRAPSAEYDQGRAVARLLIRNMYLCTGWLASADSYFITNEHCITSATDALNTDYEFMAEAPNCNDANCQLCYPGAIYSGSAFIQDSPGLDYALVQLAGNPAATYGYLEIDNRLAVVGEQVYLVSYPAGRAKEFAYNSTGDVGDVGRVISLTEPTCSGATLEVGYWNDTEGGSSGSPVLAASGHKVIALHHCHNYCDQGGDPNRGVPIDQICDEIDAYIPSCGGGSFCGDGTCDPGEDQCNCPDDCGTPPSVETGLCTDGVDNDCDTDVDCDDADCTGDPACICNNNGTCEEGEDCNNCSGDCISGSGGTVCGNGLCEAGDGEDCRSCSADCNGKTTGAPSGRFCCGATEGCGDSRCNETGWSCTTDPQGTSYCCGDGACEGAEDINNCAIDCGCTVPADCDDSNECTVDDCVGGVCENSWPACGLSDGCCGPTCDSSDPDCDPCVPAGGYCTSSADCCSNSCHPAKNYCR